MSFLYGIWFVEVITLVVAFGLLAFIFGVLVIFNNRPIGETGQSIFSSLPTPILNFLVSLMRIAKLLPVTSAIAQLKWNWYKKPNRLSDIEVHGDATRGPYGSIKMLTTPRFWYDRLVLCEVCSNQIQ